SSDRPASYQIRFRRVLGGPERTRPEPRRRTARAEDRMPREGALAHRYGSLAALVLVGLAGATISGPTARPIPGAAAPSPPVFSLPAGPGCPRWLPPAGDVYEIELPADTYLHAAFDQEGTDVAVTAFAPGPRRLYRIDSPNGAHGAEEVHLMS